MLQNCFMKMYIITFLTVHLVVYFLIYCYLYLDNIDIYLCILYIYMYLF